MLSIYKCYIDQQTWMSFWISEDRFYQDPVTSRDESFGNNAQSFVGNWCNFPVNIFLSIFIVAAPVGMALSIALLGPVLLLTFS